MNTKLRNIGSLLAAAAAWTAVSPAGAALLYQNLGNPPPEHLGAPYTLAVGPDFGPTPYAAMAQGGNQVIVQGWQPASPSNGYKDQRLASIREFECDYWSTGPVKAQLFFYDNLGAPYGSPSGPNSPLNPYYTSSVFDLPAAAQGLGSIKAGVAEGDWLNGAMVLPHEFTWAVKFSGLTGTNMAGLVVMTDLLPQWYGTGTNVNAYSYWQYEKTNLTDFGWVTRTNVAGTFFGFAAEINGELVPEPSPILYGAVLCGGIGFWMVRRRMQRASVAK